MANFDVELFQEFISDPDLGQAIEALKRANDIFDIIDPLETQHSQILQWLLNPREGHGQGDAIFKDFLTAAWANCEVEDGLNADFFTHWTPARINLTGFHSILLLLEFHISTENKLDFFIVDPVNRFIILVENKYKARHDNGQLIRYRESVQILIKRDPNFKDYHVALIALDRGHSTQLQLSELTNHWVYLDYSWLKSGATRAEAQLRRGNQSASLLISYCQRQADYESEADKVVDTILSRLTRRYSALLKPLAQARSTRVTEAQGMTLGDPASDLWLFAHHHPELVDRLARLKSLSFVKAELEEALPAVRFEYETGDAWMRIFDDAWYEYTEPDENDAYWWPFFLRVWALQAHGEDTATEPMYGVSIVYREGKLRADLAERLHASMEKAFPELASGKQNADRRRVLTIEVKEADIRRELVSRYHLLSSALRRA
ncbi:MULTISPECIES: PDDEXK-like family protein [Paraburkholderia]|uniref:PDDEXK-like family protein n=1 Tax=Paraburkholderia TaxID=1822464 RepID=UPI00224EF9D1|nr:MULTISPECIES: PD-(D/E)XK nuclease family protein [Paraburkholderia]MCX4176796.1 PD-(D/E)XK nuclease family protein [Paraburkholderia madseniana]MDQ6464787.1 PD-(D/E)XK nuclease family protein [Paraburkholderia madseniana]